MKSSPFLFVFIISLGLAGCVEKQSDSQLNQIKIQIGEQAPALVIQSEGHLLKSVDGSGAVSWIKPALNCNQYGADGSELYLPDDFDPAHFDSGDCAVFGWTAASSISSSYPAYKAGTKAIYLEGSRAAYPLGYRMEAAEDLAISVSACTIVPNASDIKDYKNCLAEKKDFFAAETQDLDPDTRKKVIGQAVLEALQVLTYNDAGLSQCYEDSLLATDALEQQFPHPLQPNVSIFRGLRQRSDTMAIAQEELDYLHEIIASGELRKPVNGYDAYTLRALLGLRLGYTYGSLDNKIVPEAFEPFGDLTAKFEKEADQRLKAVMKTADTERLSFGVDNILLFDDGGLQTILSTQGNNFFIAANGSVDNLGEQTIKIPEGSNMTQAKSRILADIVYRAVLLAKASGLKPLDALTKLKDEKKFQESCRDYAEYRPGLPSGRDQLVRAFLVNPELSNKPTIATGTFKGTVLDSENQTYKTGIPPVALRRSPDCKSVDNPDGYCPMHLQVESSANPRYSAIKVRVKNLFSLTNRVWEKNAIPVQASASKLILISGKDSADLVAKGFFKSNTILPIIEIEGILKDPAQGSDLLFSSKLNRRAVSCGEHRVGDEYWQPSDHGSEKVRCGEGGKLEIIDTLCDESISGFCKDYELLTRFDIRSSSGPDLGLAEIRGLDLNIKGNLTNVSCVVYTVYDDLLPMDAGPMNQQTRLNAHRYENCSPTKDFNVKIKDQHSPYFESIQAITLKIKMLSGAVEDQTILLDGLGGQKQIVDLPVKVSYAEQFDLAEGKLAREGLWISPAYWLQKEKKKLYQDLHCAYYEIVDEEAGESPSPMYRVCDYDNQLFKNAYLADGFGDIPGQDSKIQRSFQLNLDTVGQGKSLRVTLDLGSKQGIGASGDLIIPPGRVRKNYLSDNFGDAATICASMNLDLVKARHPVSGIELSSCSFNGRDAGRIEMTDHLGSIMTEWFIP
jgi:hypothetical protein